MKPLPVALASLFVALGCLDPTVERPGGPATDWPAFGGAPGGGHYSEANEITRANVHALELAWVHRSGDYYEPAAVIGESSGTANTGTSFQATPILVDGWLYYTTPFNRVFSLDPTTGAERWQFDPQVPIDRSVYTPPARGVSSWKDSHGQGPCPHRIFLGTIDGRLIGIDAATGQRCAAFGENGEVDLAEGLTRHRRIHDYAVTSPPAVLGDALILGAWVIDGNHPDAPSGVVRAYDARSGDFLWGWNAVPPGEDARDADGDFRRATANVWSIISVDPERNLVLVPTGNPYPDYYGADRRGLDHYASSVVALDGTTGELHWSFQTVHHDVWDFDVPAQPSFVDLQKDGRTIPAVVQVTKMGLTFVLDRETGETFFAVEERPVPIDGAVPEEQLHPTQPFPTRPPPLVQLGISPDDAWGLTPWDRGACREKLEQLRTGPIYTPQTLGGTAFYPSQIGGHNWGSPAIDPVRKWMVVNTNHIPVEARLVPRESCEEERVVYPQQATPYCYDAKPLVSPLGIPCTAPPWGTLSVVDLEAGELVWTQPMGAVGTGLLSLIRGGVTIGGPLVTGTGLLFIGASQDPVFRALDIETGEELWQHELPTTANSVPMTYRLVEDGPQFVVVAAGGHFAGISDAGDHLMAFALPRSEGK